MTEQTPRPPLRLGLAGLGTVGAGVAQMLRTHDARIAEAAGRPITISAVSARDRTRDRGVDLSGVAWEADPVALATRPDIDVLVELIGGDEGPARLAVEAALRAGKSVVTANKALLAKHGMGLAALAESHGVALNFEAAVAGGIPIVKALRESFLGNRISRIYGILNGTCNFILTRMTADGQAFADALAEAQALGYAEADPTFDVGGFDTAHKLSLLTALAFGCRTNVEAIYVEGIERITREDIAAADALGYRIKLLGVAVATESGIEQRVHPAMVAKHSALAEVSGVTNCVTVDADFLSSVMLIGPGAGAGATASSVMSDIVDVARGVRFAPFARPASRLAPYAQAEMRTHLGGYYIRLSVIDRPGAFAAIAGRMAEHAISLASIVQRPGANHARIAGAPVPVVMITHGTTEHAIRRALDAIMADGHVLAPPQMIRIEEL